MLGQRIATLRPVARAVDRKLRGSTLQRERLAVWTASPLCAACGRILTLGELELDHIVPLSEGGTDARANLQMLCVDCHRAKSEREGRVRAGWRGE